MPKNKRVAGLPTSPLETMKRGTKSMWLRQHRDLVLECRGIFGDDWCQHFFCLSPTTFKTLVNTQPKIQPWQVKAKQYDDILSIKLDIFRSEIAELRNSQRELESLFNRFVETTSNQIAKTLIIPLMRNVLKFEGDLPDTSDPLSLDRLLAEASSGCSRDAKRKYIGGICRILHE